MLRIGKTWVERWRLFPLSGPASTKKPRQDLVGSWRGLCERPAANLGRDRPIAFVEADHGFAGAGCDAPAGVETGALAASGNTRT